jgi:hypothetical protein
VLKATSRGQLLSQHEYETTKATKRKKENVYKLRLFKFKYIFVKILIELQTALTAETHPTEGH